MDRDVELLRALASFLEEHGYPPDAFAIDWKVGERYRVDLAVVDPESAEPVALFELKSKADGPTLKMGMEQLRAYWKALGQPDVPLYLVTPDPERGFTLHRFDADETARGNLIRVPDFALLRSTRNRKATAELVNDRKKSIDRLAVTSWGVASVVGFLTIADLVGAISVTPERLGLLALLAGLIVLPFASKLKLLGLEFERHRDSSREL